ncbi:conserved hypothetical protein [Perkinsus marinus ATCC 50983]|uniref:Reverse transcriptase domain-containing protein n=1 Tax=Perkinsus marinus (strain ATCC 50983 / TXsc) TaxID=423536 RepID=C5KPR8_PERM5|nr:conserved hypothetical protein [Perkinsus marinus ATCC 50983]EER13465.1 conserved hypothetical protein [Perkinsus marinus ATCC 50983]|eukprot:XP_002781670.1 conserved hypothetical protein [Perkinsus marinus ATCC 50983]
MDLLAFFLIGKLLESVDDVSSSNIVIIPLSIYQTLAMSALGVIGSTADRICKLAGVATVAKLLDIDYNCNAMPVANSVCPEVLRDDYLTTVKSRLPGSSAHREVSTASRINVSIAENPRHMIGRILGDDPLRDDVVLVSAAYSKDSCLKVFSSHFTQLFAPKTCTLPALEPVDLPIERTGGDDITLDEVKDSLCSMDNGKAPGANGVLTSALKAGGEHCLRILHRLCKEWWSEPETIPRALGHSIIIPFYKKGDRKVAGNYRGINLLDHIGKVYSGVLGQRLKPLAESFVGEKQFGFLPAKGTLDAVHVLRRCQEVCNRNGRRLSAVFLDLKAAFDKVPRPAIWRALRLAGCDEKLISAIESLHRNTVAQVKTQEGLSDPFPIDMGTRQGCRIAPLLFIIFMEMVIREANLDISLSMPCESEGSTESVDLSGLLFADDIVLLADDDSILQRNLDKLSAALTRFGMEVSLPKTKCMILSEGLGDSNLRLKIAQRRLRWAGRILTTKPADGLVDYRQKGSKFQESKFHGVYLVTKITDLKVQPILRDRQNIRSFGQHLIEPLNPITLPADFYVDLDLFPDGWVAPEDEAPADGPAEEPPAEPVGEAAAELEHQPVDEAANPLAAEAANLPADGPAGQLVDEPARQGADEPAGQLADGPARQAPDEPAGQHADEVESNLRFVESAKS